ncbi:uncharacterized protein LOC119105545 [Pollicipes pollicipes]|uniref:uncharacterized protein LOC119105545 n=1 Tax=Pollicipes pollicipes TaxID=41117 RepID=UPI001885322D|nr:uncharacterized protein LOC119105545 [Pollicipes pollicipes]
MITAVCTVGVLLQVSGLTYGLPRPAGADLNTAPNYYISVVVPPDTAQERSSASDGDQPYSSLTITITIVRPSNVPPPSPPLPEEAPEDRVLSDVLRTGCASGLSPCGSSCCYDVSSDNTCPPGTTMVDGGCVDFN